MNLFDSLPCPDLALPLQQHPIYADAVRQIGGHSKVFSLRDGPRRIGHAVLVERRLPWGSRIGLTSLGPIWRDHVPWAQQKKALALLSSQGLRLINATPPTAPLALAGFRQIMTAATCARLDIEPTPEAQRRALRQKWRNRLGTGAPDLKISHAPYHPGRHGWLLREDAAQARRRRYTPLPAPMIEAFRALAHQDLQIFMAHPPEARTSAAGMPLAAMLFLRHGPVATYLVGHTTPEGRQAEAHRHLLMAATDWMRHDNVRHLDLGTLDTERAPGLARFKLGTGARVVSGGGTWLRLRRAKPPPPSP